MLLIQMVMSVKPMQLQQFNPIDLHTLLTLLAPFLSRLFLLRWMYLRIGTLNISLSFTKKHG